MWSKPLRWNRVLIGLALVGLLIWRMWMIPCIDIRLVGRWECVTPTPGREFVTLSLRGDGRGKHTWQEGDTSQVLDYPWAVCGRTLQIHLNFEPSEYSDGLWRIVDRVAMFIAARQVERANESWQLLSVTRDELRMRQRSDSQVQIFRRIPSGLDP